MYYVEEAYQKERRRRTMRRVLLAVLTLIVAACLLAVIAQGREIDQLKTAIAVAASADANAGANNMAASDETAPIYADGDIPTESATETEENEPDFVSLGEFKIYHYAPTGNRTATGTIPEAGRTVAVDPAVIPLGSEVIVNGHVYIAEDTGRDIKGKVIDIFVASEAEAKNLGVKYAEVFLKR
jgi:3D (Asp-Asp-Asp) domain-containing protein